MNIETMQAELERCPQLKAALEKLIDEFDGFPPSVDFMAQLELIAQVVGRV